MKLLPLSIASLAVLVAASPVSKRAVGTTVALDYATYQGFTTNGVTKFLGMSFAAPPTGDLRWKAPQSPATTSGVQPAIAFKSVCPGYNETIGIDVITDYSYGEDCLGISVHIPASVDQSSKLPVLFYISGGGFSELSNANYNFDDFVNASGGSLIVVQANYRVGALGFLSGSEVSSGGDLNAGLLDQRLALQWTQKYISAFGGDPDHVVMLGGSAGAGSVGLHLSAYGGRDDSLFVGAVADAAFYPEVNNATFSQFQFDQFASNLGCGSSSDKLGCLRQVDIVELQTYNVQQAYPGHSMLAEYIWTPVVDGSFITDTPLNLFQNGQFVKVPLITGDVTNEGTIFAYNANSPEDVSTFISANYPSLTSDDLAQINDLYPLLPAEPFHNSYFPSAAAAYGEGTFKCPVLLISTAMFNAGASVWNYEFNQSTLVESLAGYGVPHNIDLGAMFGPNVSPTGGIVSLISNIVDFSSYSSTGENAAVTPLMMDYIISFTKYLDPNVAKNINAIDWQPYSVNGVEQRVVIQDSGTTMQNIPSDMQTRCDFWNSVIPVTGQ